MFRSLKLIALFSTAFLFTSGLSGCGGPSNPTMQEERPPVANQTNAPKIARGRTIYDETCDNCHGENGRGIGDNPSLVKQWRQAELVAAIEEHTPILPIPCLDECADDAAHFIRATFEPKPELANTGRLVYVTQCALCHGVRGEGGSGGPLTPDVCNTCSDLETLAERTDKTMPTQDITQCDRTVATDFCAYETARYILAGFEEIDEDGNILGAIPAPPPPPPPPPAPEGCEIPTDEAPAEAPPVVEEQPVQEVDGIPNRGGAFYLNLCLACHGPTGEGIPTLPGSNLIGAECENCTDLETLTAYNDAKMPITIATPDTCTDSAETDFCAREVSAYMLSGYREVIAPTPPEAPAPAPIAPPEECDEEVAPDEEQETPPEAPEPPPEGEAPEEEPAPQPAPEEPAPEACEHWSSLFNEIYDTVLRNGCDNCHGLNVAQFVTQFVIRDDYSQDIASFYEQSIIIHQDSGLPMILAKPTNLTRHLGGAQFNTSSLQYKAIKAVTDRIHNPTCSKD